MSLPDPIFWVTVFTTDGTEERVDERVLTLEYEDDETKADKLKLTVDNYDLANFDKAIWKNGNKIQVSWGYAGNMSPTRECWIQAVKGGLILTVEALGKEALMNKVQRLRTFEYMKRSEVVAQIAEENGFGPELQFIDDTAETQAQVSQARMTDWQLIRDLAKREGYEAYADFDGFHFHKRKLGQKPVRKFIYFTDPGRGDIITWNVENDIFTRKSAGVTVQGIDPLTKKPINETGDNTAAKDRTALAPEVGLVLGISSRDGSVTGERERPGASGETVVNTTERTKEAAKRQAAGTYGKNQLNAVDLTMTCRGDPQFVAKTVCEVQGIGKTISGNYYAKSVTHKLGDGYTMAVKAKRDGKSQGTGANTGVKAAGATNAAKAPETTGGPPADLLPVDRRDGTVQYSDAGGRTQDATPPASSEADPTSFYRD